MADEAKKPGLMLAIGMGKPKPPAAEGPESVPDAGAEEDEGDFDSAATGVMDALKSGDAEAFKTALKLAVMSCKSEY